MSRRRKFMRRLLSTIYVVTHCDGERVDERTVDITDVHEDMQGRDVVLFKCKKCGDHHESLRFGR